MSTDNKTAQDAQWMSARTIRLLKLSIVIMTLLIIAGLIALVIGMRQQADKLFSKTPPVQNLAVKLPEGLSYRGMAAAGEDGLIWIETVNHDGQVELLAFDKKGRLVRRLNLEQAR